MRRAMAGTGAKKPHASSTVMSRTSGMDLALYGARGGGGGGEEAARLLDGHVEDVGDGLALVRGAEGLVVVAAALAHLAWDVDIREEVHLYPDLAVAPARLAPAALHVEREAAGLVAPYLGLRRRGEELADVDRK